LQLKDLENVEKRLEKVKRAAKTGNKEAIVEETLLNRIRETLLPKLLEQLRLKTMTKKF
jgi:ribosome-binding ATPase YchF (GTP1/OBG family)